MIITEERDGVTEERDGVTEEWDGVTEEWDGVTEEWDGVTEERVLLGVALMASRVFCIQPLVGSDHRIESHCSSLLALENQHGIAITKKPVSLLYGYFIGFPKEFPGSKRRDQQQ